MPSGTSLGWKERKSPRWNNVWKQKGAKLQCSKTGTTPKSRVKASNMGQYKQLDLGHANKYLDEATNTRAHNQTHSLKSKVLNREGSGNGRTGQRLAPDDLGGVGEASPHYSPSKEGGNSTEPELEPCPEHHKGNQHIW